MEESQTQKSPLSVPVAIIVAGAIIAGAVFFSRGSTTLPTSTNTNAEKVQTPPAETQNDIVIRSISDADHLLGNPGAPLAIIEYSDTECPFCKSFHSTMKQVTDSYGKNGKVLWVYRHFPIDQLHPKAPHEAEATECAYDLGGNDAFWKFTNKIFEVTPSNNGLDPAELPKIAIGIGLNQTKFNECLQNGKNTEKVQKDYEEAVTAGGRGTPYSVFVYNKPLSDAAITAIKSLSASFPPDTFTYSTDKRRVGMSGALPYSIVQKIIDTILQG